MIKQFIRYAIQAIFSKERRRFNIQFSVFFGCCLLALWLFTHLNGQGSKTLNDRDELLEIFMEDDMVEQGRKAIHKAVINGSLPKTKELLKKGADINARTRFGETPLHYAIAYKQHEIMEFLIEKGCDLNGKSNHGYTPLHNAVFFRNLYAIALLLKKGADISIKDVSGKTPLSLAEFLNSEAAAELLRNHQPEG